MELHQIVVSAAPHDAVTNSALEIRKLLRTLGPSELFARNIDERLQGDVLQIHEVDHGGARRLGPMDLVIFHGSIGDEEVFRVVQDLPCRVVLMYHNVSPASAFRPYDPLFAELLHSGRQQIAGLRDRVTLALAPSQFNADELVAMGFPHVDLSPLIIDHQRLVRLEPDAATEAMLAELDGPLFLFVGQLLPHKRPDLLLQAFHILSTYLLPGAHLAVVGTGRLEPYRQRLERFARELNLRSFLYPGPIDDASLAAYFRRADVFVTATDHEGFCVPLIEAMAFGVPIAARAAGAVPETMAGAGIAVGLDDGPATLAEAMYRLATDQPLRDALVARGRDRAETFAAERAQSTLLRHLLAVA